MSYTLDKSILLEHVADGVYCVNNDPAYWNYKASFGGWMAAVALNAVYQHPEFRGEVLTQQIQFIAALKPDQLYLRVHRHQQGQLIDFYQVSIQSAPKNGRTLATTEIIAGERTDSKLEYAVPMPPLKPIAECMALEASEMTPRWLAQFEQHLAKGQPFSKNPTPMTLAYAREADGRPLDSRAIVALADTPMPRTFFVTDQLLFGYSLSLSTHIYASSEEIAAVGTDYVAIASDSSVIRHGLLNQEVRLFRRDGLLLATSYQTAIF